MDGNQIFFRHFQFFWPFGAVLVIRYRPRRTGFLCTLAQPHRVCRSRSQSDTDRDTGQERSATAPADSARIFVVGVGDHTVFTANPTPFQPFDRFDFKRNAVLVESDSVHSQIGQQ